MSRAHFLFNGTSLADPLANVTSVAETLLCHAGSTLAFHVYYATSALGLAEAGIAVFLTDFARKRLNKTEDP